MPSLVTAPCAEVAWLCGDCSVVTRSIREDTTQLNSKRLVPLRHDATETTFNSLSFIVSNSICLELFLSGYASKSEAGGGAFSNCQFSTGAKLKFYSTNCTSNCGYRRECQYSAAKDDYDPNAAIRREV